METIFTDVKLQKSIRSFFLALEIYYPEHKVFALDSVNKNLRERLSELYKKAGYKTDEAFLAAYGYQKIAGDQVRELRPSVLYAPGHEPSCIRDKVNYVVSALEKYYPDRKIPSGIQNEHKSISQSISGLYQWLGYASSKEMLEAYGFEVLYKEKGGRPAQDSQSLIDLLQEKYKTAERPSTIAALIQENPEYAGNLKTLSNKANELFGMTLAKHFRNIGILSTKEQRVAKITVITVLLKDGRNVLCEKDDPYMKAQITDHVAVCDPKDGTEYIGEIFKKVVYTADQLPCDREALFRIKRELPIIPYMSVRILETNETVYCLKVKDRASVIGQHITVCAPDDRILIGCIENIFHDKTRLELPCAEEEMYRHVGRAKRLLYVSVDGMVDPVYCDPGLTRSVTTGDYISMLGLGERNLLPGRVLKELYVADETLPCPAQNLYQCIRKMADDQRQFTVCSVRTGDGVEHEYFSKFENVEVGDVVLLPNLWYGGPNPEGIVTDVCLKFRKATQLANKHKWIEKVLGNPEKDRKQAEEETQKLISQSERVAYTSVQPDPAITKSFSNMTYFSGAVFRGFGQDVADALKAAYPTEQNPLSRKTAVATGFYQFECLSAMVPTVLASYPALKAVFFAENWQEGCVYLAYSESGCAGVTSLRKIGPCQFYAPDRWSLLHDPTETAFSCCGIEYAFLEKEKWETCDYVLPSGQERLSGTEIIPSKPYAKESARKPYQIIEIRYPEEEIFSTEPVNEETSCEGEKESPEGINFVITGKVSIFKNRDEFTAYVTSRGGQVSGSVTNGTDYLVNNDLASTSTKNKKAKSLGVPIITEEEFVRRFGR